MNTPHYTLPSIDTWYIPTWTTNTFTWHDNTYWNTPEQISLYAYKTTIKKPPLKYKDLMKRIKENEENEQL